MPKSLYEGIKVHRGKPEEYRYIFNAHEPIVSQELFDRVQKILADNAKVRKEKMDASTTYRANVIDYFKDKIFCGDCGKKMRFVRAKRKRQNIEQDSSYYICSGYRDSDYATCSRHHIGYPVLADAVMALIQMHISVALHLEQSVKNLRGSEKERNLTDKYQRKINHLTQELKKINSKREILFENFTEDILDETEYQFAKKKYEEEAEEIQRKLTSVENRKQQVMEVLMTDNKWMCAVHQAESVNILNLELVDCLIKSVKVFENNRVEVELKYSDTQKVFEDVIREVEGDGSE